MSKNKVILVVREESFDSAPIISSVLEKFVKKEDIVISTRENKFVSQEAQGKEYVYTEYDPKEGLPNRDMVDFAIVFAENGSNFIDICLKRCKEMGIVCTLIAR